MTLCDPMDYSMQDTSVFCYLPEFAQIHVHWVGDAIQPSHPLFFPFPPAFRLSQQQGVFRDESALCIRWPEYWSFSFSISPFNECSGLISFRIDWFDLLEVQGLSKVFSSTTVQKHQFFTDQPSLWSLTLYMTTGETIALTRWTFVGKVISLILNMLSKFVITFLPRSKCLLISWLQSPSAVILEPKKINSLTISIVSPSIYHEMMGPDAWIFIFWMLSFKPASSLLFHFHQEAL